MLQHFVEDSILSHFHSQTQPQLYYMGKILPEISAYPRILHSHAEHVEISVIYSGTSEYFIGDRRQVIRPDSFGKITKHKKAEMDKKQSAKAPSGCRLLLRVPTKNYDIFEK